MSSTIPKTASTTALRSRLRHGFSPSRWLRGTEGLRQLAPGGNGQEWVLARGLCAYTVLDGAAVPARKRRGFVEMALARWAPFPDPQSHVEWSGDRAMLWAWSKSRILSAGDDGAPLDPPRRIIPESLVRGQPRARGEELVALDEGVEGRVWRDDALVTSQWWATTPSLQDWNEFRRGAGLSPAALPEVLPYPLVDRAWTAVRAGSLGDAFGEKQRRWLAALAVGAASAALVALLVGVVALKISIWQVDKRIAEREKALDKIIDARASALKSADAVEAALAMRPPAGQLDLLNQAGRLMGGQSQLQEWKMPDPKSIQLTALMASADPRTIVQAWEDSGRFSAVTAELGPRQGPPGPRQMQSVVVKALVLRPAAKQEAQPRRGAGR